MPCTFGDTYIDNTGVEVPLDTVLTTESEQRTSLMLDYILLLKPLEEPDQMKDDLTPRLRLKEGSAAIEKFMAKPGRPYTQLSDHYGVSVTIELVNSPEPELQQQPLLSKSGSSTFSNPQTASKQ